MHKVLTLKNGLKIVIEKIDGVNSVSVGVMVKNGSRNEPKKFEWDITFYRAYVF